MDYLSRDYFIPVDLQRHCIGVEYEVALERQLSEMGKSLFILLSFDLLEAERLINSAGIPFETESQLREKGSARTPDILLSLPIAFRIQSEWKVVCWIDSKVRKLIGIK